MLRTKSVLLSAILVFASVAANAQRKITTGGFMRDGSVLAVVPAVTGAPGDGNKSLTDATRRELAVKGMSIVEDKPINGNKPTKDVKGAYRVEGSVTVGDAKDGKQPIHIEWLVRDPQGKKLGTVLQKNEIPAGSLDGPWEGDCRSGRRCGRAGHRQDFESQAIQ